MLFAYWQIQMNNFGRVLLPCITADILYIISTVSAYKIFNHYNGYRYIFCNIDISLQDYYILERILRIFFSSNGDINTVQRYTGYHDIDQTETYLTIKTNNSSVLKVQKENIQHCFKNLCLQEPNTNNNVVHNKYCCYRVNNYLVFFAGACTMLYCTCKIRVPVAMQNLNRTIR